jgi:hypothetical protein
MKSMLAIFALGVLGLIVQSALLNLLPGRWVPDLGLLIPVMAILCYRPPGACCWRGPRDRRGCSRTRSSASTRWSGSPSSW